MSFELTTADGPKLVRNWGYRLQGGKRKSKSRNLQLSDITSATHDLIVIDFSKDGSGKGAFSESDVQRMKSRAGANSVIVVLHLDRGSVRLPGPLARRLDHLRGRGKACSRHAKRQRALMARYLERELAELAQGPLLGQRLAATSSSTPSAPAGWTASSPPGSMAPISISSTLIITGPAKPRRKTAVPAIRRPSAKPPPA